MTTYVLKLISMFGGLALFLFGMDVMGKSLERSAGGKLQTILAKMSSNVPKGFLLGLAVTAVIQSSSATTVMVVGFVNSGIMTLKQAVGVIMGSNVGTTVTAWILSLTSLQGESFAVQLFKPSTLAPLLGAIGIILYMFTKSDKKKNIGMIMLGFMALMTGMDMMSSAMTFLKNEAWFANLMVSFSNPILGILVGAVLTGIIQSSSASVGILQSLCATGTVTFGNAIPVILGQNIGTCVTAIIGSVGANTNAKRTAMVHLYFNIVGTLLFVTIFYGIGMFFPWEFLSNTATSVNIATIHTCFNIGATAVLMPLNGLLVKLATISVPEGKDETVALLDEILLATPAVAIQRTHEVAGEMAVTASDAIELSMKLIKEYDAEAMKKVAELEKSTDRYEDALGTYLVKLSSENLTFDDNMKLNTLLCTIADVERIADYAVILTQSAEEINNKNVNFSDQAKEELEVLSRAVSDIVKRAVSAYKNFDFTAAAEIEPRQQVIESLVREIKFRHISRLKDGLCTVEYGFVLENILNALSRIAAHCSNIAVEMIQVAEGKAETHEYLNALKSGALYESADFDESVKKYKTEYTFPQKNQQNT